MTLCSIVYIFATLGVSSLHIDAVNSRSAPVQRRHCLVDGDDIDGQFRECTVQKSGVDIVAHRWRFDGVVCDDVAAIWSARAHNNTSSLTTLGSTYTW